MPIEVIREVTPQRLEELQGLLDAVTEHDHHPALGEHKWLDLVHGGRAGFAGVVASNDDSDEPIGYAHISRHREKVGAEWGLEVVVHPDHRGTGIEIDLARTALDIVAEAGGGHLHLWVFQPTDVHDDLAQQLGLRRGRDLLHMAIALPIRHDVNLEDLRIRPFEPGRDEQAWLELNNRAFAHHPEQGAWDMATLERRMSEPWFDPADLLMAEDDDGLAGSNWTKLDHDKRIGEIYVIAVDPSRHGGGLGKVLTVAGLKHMADRGMREGTLYVDAANEKALALYRKIGFTDDHLDRAYVADIDPR